MAPQPIATLKDASVKIVQLEDTIDIYKKKLTEVVVTNVMESIEKDVQYSLLKREIADVQKESIAKTEKCNDLTNMLNRARNLGAVSHETTPPFVRGMPKRKKRVHSEDNDSIATSALFPISMKRVRTVESNTTTCSTYPVTRTVSSTLSTIPRHVSVSQCTADSNAATKTVSECGSAAPSDSATSQHTEDPNEDEGSDAGSDAGSESGSEAGSGTGSEAGSEADPSEAGSSEAGSSEAGSQQSSAAPSESATSSLSDYDQCKCKDCVAKVTTSKNKKTATKC